MRERIAVTGLGVLTPIGNDVNSFTDHLFKGTIGTGPIRSFDTAPYEVKNGGEVKGFDPEPFIKKLNPHELDRTSQFAIAVTRMALEHAGLDPEDLPRKRVGVIFGTTLGNQQTLERHVDGRLSGDTSYPVPYRRYSAQTISSCVGAEFGFRGPNLVIPTACAAGNYAIGYAADMIKRGKSDYMICGGTDAISRTCFTMFARLNAIAPEICQPFDQNRKGMMVSEGAGVLLLERYDLAVKRGATIYAEFAGYANSCDAFHVTAPHPEGDGAVLAMRKALENSGLTPENIDYISAHGTGTPANDKIEAKAVHKIFGERSRKIPISSIKSMIGHTMGAASAIEAVASVLAIHYGRVPPNANLRQMDPDFPLLVANEAIEMEIHAVLSNSFAFGGNISTLILKKQAEAGV
ncbi:beta-ketoacyl-[acyl-carrier-protein] synthase family protein [Laceyella putida]|uniref:Beta-ketoacyl-[acyl-carrier-protein] synthase family protein n=1 Tax=Laceyella putida TaxID=110101 RepID=A0ABW2RHS7_9BACL